MRNFRKAAFAGATAVAVAFGSTAVAAADTTLTPAEQAYNDAVDRYLEENKDKFFDRGVKVGDPKVGGETSGEGTNLTKYAEDLGAIKKVKVAETVDKDGNTKDVNAAIESGVNYDTFFFGDDWENSPVWVKLLSIGGVATVVSAIVGLIVGPAYNFFVHGPVNF